MPHHFNPVWGLSWFELGFNLCNVWATASSIFFLRCCLWGTNQKIRLFTKRLLLWHAVYSSFCPPSSINLAKSLISFQLLFLHFQNEQKPWGRKRNPNVWIMSLDCPRFLMGVMYSPNLHCLSSSWMPLNRFETIFSSSFCCFQGSGDGPKLLIPFLPGAKSKLKSWFKRPFLFYSPSSLF